MNFWIQVAAAFAGSIGFALFLKIRGKQVVYAGIGGALTWAIYLLMHDAVQSYFIASFIASCFVAVYAEIMARVNRAPATIFLTAAAVPMIPGGNLYYMMYGLMTENTKLAQENGMTALVIALAISFGFILVTVLNRYRLALFSK
ncbi:MAG: threonine/serine exporter family protein [Anaerovoracaceae bacterium]|jgi:uncharacterized membrane protein YjjB (DUF3815 family)